jgi:hypothetical protein
MKKTTKGTVPAGHEGKGFLDLAGEAMKVLGEEIVEGKDKLMDAASEKFESVKKAVKKKFAKKKATPKPKRKSAPAKKAAKKTARKVAPKKAAKKSATAKKKRR